MRMIPILATWFLLSGALANCAKRSTAEIDVDEVQARVDTVEQHLISMQDALKDKRLEEAEERYELAVEEMEENDTVLSVYPEIGMLRDQVQEAGSELCNGFVNISLERFFTAVRGQDAEEARSRLERCQEEFQRCQKQIQERDDFAALKMNLDSAPQALADLERRLALQERLRQIRAFQEELAPRIQAVGKKLASLEKRPAQSELAAEVDGEITDIRTTISEEKEFGKNPAWTAYASKVSAELDAMSKRQKTCVRRGQVLRTVQTVLPKASRSATRAVATRKRTDALELVRAAHQGYSQCEATVAEGLKAEPALAKFTFRWRGIRRSVAWLQRHCAAKRRTFERMITKLSGKRKRPPPKKVAPQQSRKPPAAKQAEEKKKGKKKRKRRGRVRRW